MIFRQGGVTAGINKQRTWEAWVPFVDFWLLLVFVDVWILGVTKSEFDRKGPKRPRIRKTLKAC